MANVHIRFNDIDHYEPSDSDNELTEKEHQLLNKNRKKSVLHSDSEEEVLAINNSESSDDDINIANSDIDEQDQDDLPDIRAWGKDKRNFYSTDYVDQDYGGYQGKDAQAAEFEEEEAKSIQKRLAEQLNDEDFSFDLFDKNLVKSHSIEEQNEEIVKSDLSSLSKRELIQFLEKESPELFILIKDCTEKLSELKSYLHPLFQKNKNGFIDECEALEFTKTLYHLILNYSTNINMYILLKANKVNVQNHPVLKRLYQYRQLIAQLEPIYLEIVKPQIEIILNDANTNEDNLYLEDMQTNSATLKKKKKLNVLENLKEKSKKITDNAIVGKISKKKSILKNEKSVKANHVSFDIINAEANKKSLQGESNNSNDINTEIDKKDDNTPVENSKRGITYQIAKNKGLIPSRKKEQRNPRVKHRNKFRKANIRRKGAVREVRKELTRYGGEISGIKASVSKSIKLK